MKKSSFLSLLRFMWKGKHDGDMHGFVPLQGNVRSFLGRNLVKIKIGLFKKFDLLQNHSKSCILIFSAHLPH